jgi:hypothetical protein
MCKVTPSRAVPRFTLPAPQARPAGAVKANIEAEQAAAPAG